MSTPMIFRLRRRYEYQWTQENPVLLEGEPGYERVTGKLKIGNGVSRWNDLAYFVPSGGTLAPGSSDAAVLAHINSSVPHPAYDEGPSLVLLYQNAKV